MAEMELGTPGGSRFQLDNEKLRALNVSKDVKELAELGGIEGLAAKLHVDINTGLPQEEEEQKFADRIAQFGPNEFIEPPMVTLWELILAAVKEPILILLIISALVSIGFGVGFADEEHRKTGWIEGFAIIIAVFLVVGVTAGNDYSKEKKFRALNKVKNDRLVKVRRNGKEAQVSITTIQVGDIAILDTGDQVPADGVFIDGHELAVDESAMTGESDAVKKTKAKPFMLSGCQVSTGSGLMIITAVGMNSEWGITYSKLIVPREETPLQEKLSGLAKLIGYVGMAVAGLLFIILTIIFIVEHATADEKFQASELRDFIQFVILCITIVVVAVPEGLPLAVTISLAYSMKAMLKDNNLVRHLAACETMGGATNICSDKTGTLTENLMTVTHVWIAGKVVTDELEHTLAAAADKDTVELLCVASDANSTAFLRWNDEKKKNDFIGSKTECALLVLSNKMGHDYAKVRKEQNVLTLFPFSSDRKRMSTLVANKSASRLYTKGASEIILGLCDTYLNAEGKVCKLQEEDIEGLKKTIDFLASEGLRTLSVAYKDIDSQQTDYDSPPEDNLTLIGIVGIKDPLRKEVPPAIQTCKLAGITVRMVTGDNKLTATRIAQDCGILEEGFIVMEGPDFRKLSDEELDKILPKLRVLARSSPSDKHRLVTRLKFHREVVAVTGDGTNDGPALKAADVGMAMGIAGTEIAKEASDIIIMDDNFASIVKSVMWGRSVRGNIQKFLQFQLSVNAVALAIAFVSAVAKYGEPLSPIQLLWVNLIQDTFAALALATEKPSEDLLLNKPAGRRERLITPLMWRNIICTALWELLILFGIVFAGDYLFNIADDEGVNLDKDSNIRFTLVFNVFVFMQIFNEINARRLDNKWNAFERFFTNWLFLSIIIGTALVQGLIVSVGGIAFHVVRLTWKFWIISILLGVTMIPWGIIYRCLIPSPEFEWLKYERKKKTKAKHDKRKKEKKEVTAVAEMELP
eukprot:TRINITY_DN634_c0_g1_i1.p1 TRINITY_DN634_c0_g1~~TRINITY_DN634_c0_g1_i1.p1  ORF type:complete len:979 (-),score=333.99 TRINITY_DN634_c0_g1_i1:136-3072(-)